MLLFGISVSQTWQNQSLFYKSKKSLLAVCSFISLLCSWYQQILSVLPSKYFPTINMLHHLPATTLDQATHHLLLDYCIGLLTASTFAPSNLLSPQQRDGSYYNLSQITSLCSKPPSGFPFHKSKKQTPFIHKTSQDSTGLELPHPRPSTYLLPLTQELAGLSYLSPHYCFLQTFALPIPFFPLLKY